MRRLVHRKSMPGPVGLRPCGSAQSWNGRACATSCFPRSVQARFAKARFKTARLAYRRVRGLFSHLMPLLRYSLVFAFQNRGSRTKSLPLTFGGVVFVYL